MMSEAEVTRLTNFYLKQHGLYGWKITFGNALGQAGSCKYSSKTLRFSREYLKHSTLAGIRNTITHEVAHAIAGPGSGHGPAWQKIHKSMGGDGQRTVAESQIDTKALNAKRNNYVICRKCHTVIGKSTRKIKTVGVIHRACGGDIVNVHKSLAEAALAARTA